MKYIYEKIIIKYFIGKPKLNKIVFIEMMPYFYY